MHGFAVVVSEPCARYVKDAVSTSSTVQDYLLYCIVLYCVVYKCTVWTVLYCIVLHCIYMTTSAYPKAVRTVLDASKIGSAGAANGFLLSLSRASY